jgi:hypothetical protein
MRHVCVAILTLVLLLSFRHSAIAAELAEQAKSLRMVPADVAFYSSSLRLKEQFEAFRESNAYARLMQIPMIQFVKGQIETQWQLAALPGVQEFKDYVESEEGQEVAAVLGEMFSDEAFLYGGSEITQWLQVVMELNGIQRNARLESNADDVDPQKMFANRLLEVFEERADDFSVPTLVLGFRVQDSDKAKAQLDTVQGHLRTLLDDKQPELSAHLQREQIAEHEFLTLRLDGSMIPWEKLREDVDEEDVEYFDRIRDLVNEKTVAVALGVVGENVLISIGESTEHLEKLGDGPFLADHEAIKRLAKHADERVASISYMSQDLAKNLSSPKKTVDDLANTIDQALEEAEVDDEQRKKLVDDIQSLDLSKYMPTPGETSAIVFLTDRGYEGFQYQTGTRPMMNSSKPLEILNHIGGSPLMCFASRTNDTVKDYNEAIEWLEKTAQHVEEIAESKSDAEDWAEYLKHRGSVIELLGRLDDANREHIYPALTGTEAAFVIDATAESQQWTRQAPKSPTALPMLEFGLVTTVKDADHLRQGIDAYGEVLRDGIELLREIKPDALPGFEIPEPDERETEGGGKLYVYSLPEAWGIDEQVAPSAGLTESTATLSIMPATAERLLQSTPQTIDTSLDLTRPAATVVHFKFAELISKIRPWIDYGLAVGTGTLKNEEPKDEESDERENGADEAEEEEPAQTSPLAFQLGFFMPQVYQLLDVLSAFRSVTLITYEDDGVWVTHSETHIEDLKED